MSPQSLLFSSDQETSRRLIQTLQELELEVEHCPEIFAAVEKITSRSFDIIVSDWREGLEAAFLLKTARELKANSGAFTIAVADADSARAAREAGANFVLIKPIVPDKAKYALLTCDQFLRHMRTWLPKLGFQPGEENSSSAGAKSWPMQRPIGHTAETTSAPPQPSPDSRNNISIQTLFASLERYAAEPARTRKSYSRSLLVAALCVALLSAGYVFSQPLRNQSVTTAVVKIYGRAVEKTHAWLDKHGEDDDEETPLPYQVAQNDNPSSTRSRTGPVHIRITPAPGFSVPSQPVPIESVPRQPAAESQPAIVAANTPHIPASLQTPIQGASLRDVSAKVTSSLLASLEPVTLPEDLAQKLLLQKVPPNYPEQAVKAGLQGPVVLQAWIARDGTIRELKLIRGSFLLGQAAYKAVRQWRYQPYLLNGRAVEAQTYVTVDFKLP
jgi:TonB family protein